MKRTLIQNAVVINEGRKVLGSVVIENEKIAEILVGEENATAPCDEIIDATGCYLLPGAIDEHVHFRDPGLTHKADITTESRAAAAGGVTSIMDMPNTNPQTTTLEALEEKFVLLGEKSAVNYSCYFGATNNNYTQFAQLDKHRVCGVKLFMGSSTGNMLVDRMASLRNIFGGTDLLIAAHCEDQGIIKENTDKYKKEYGDDVPLALHPLLRSEEACYRSSELAVQLARETNARLHIMHISTAKELSLFSNVPLVQKKITAEACVSHLLFTEEDYQTLGARIKCNPAIKTAQDRKALREAVNSGLIDAIATDHAPHLLSEKEGGALKAMSGMPMIQFSLVSMLELTEKGVFTIEKVVEKMAHAPAQMYEIQNRGFIRKGYQADLVLVRPGSEWTVTTDCILSKCKWSPLEGHTFDWKVEKKLCKANSDGDNLIIEKEKDRFITFPLLRQQTPKRDGSPFLCLSDFIRPISSGIPDTIGAFASSIDADMEGLYEQDPYKHLLVQTLSDRLAEAATEKMHEYVRKEAWGYAKDENLGIADLLVEKYQGIRPAVGYPSLPDQSVNFLLDELLDMKQIGISLTENGAMYPHASVCGLMFSHPASEYFSVGKIGEDQLEDYARRRGKSIEEMCKFLAANLQ